VGYSKLVRQKQLRKALLQLYLLAVIDFMFTKGQIQVCVLLKAEVG